MTTENIKNTEKTEIKKNVSNGKVIVSKQKLLEAGTYFGHKKNVRNSQMTPYILTTKKQTDIIDILKTQKFLEFAYQIVYKFALKNANFIFVGTKKHAKKTIMENAIRVRSPYVSERWLGGTLTNNRTIFSRVKRLEEIEKLKENNYYGFTKKEGVLFDKELSKLNRNLSGIRKMRQMPNIMIVSNPKGDEIAIKEAKKLNIKTIGIIDSNVNPSIVDIAIPANDDSEKSINLIITILADAISDAKNGEIKYAFKKDEEIVLPEDKEKSQRYKNNRFRRDGKFNNRFKSENNYQKNRRESNSNSTETIVKPKTISKTEIKKSEPSNDDSKKEVKIDK